MKKKILALLLTLSLLLPIFPTVIAADTCVFGKWTAESITADRMEAWLNNAENLEQLKALINSQELRPQRTGWLELDAMLDQMVSDAGESADACTVLSYMYNWLVKNVTYSWLGYSYTSASLSAYNSFTGYDYTGSMTYETGLQKSIPDDMANRAYHVLKDRQGVCYDYAIAFAVMARYVGIEAYVHTGYFAFETYIGSGHHGWAELVLDGTTYIFDAQRDARNYQQNYGHNFYYFGIAPGNAWRYNTAYDKAANQERDASLLPVTAERARQVTLTLNAQGPGQVSGGGACITGQTAVLRAVPDTGMAFYGWYDANGNWLSGDETLYVTVKEDAVYTAQFAASVTLTVSRSGTVSGGGLYPPGSNITLTAVPNEGKTFEGWYTPDGALVSQDAVYSISVTKNCHFIAMFSGDIFYDIPANAWYETDAIEAANRDLVYGTSPLYFDGAAAITRAMAVTLLSRLDAAELDDIAESTFLDVPVESWYAQIVAWACENGIVSGRDERYFDPNTPITREEFLTMLMRYIIDYKDMDVNKTELIYSDADQISDYAMESVQLAQGMGLIQGDNTGLLHPRDALQRSEGIAILMRLVRILDAE